MKTLKDLEAEGKYNPDRVLECWRYYQEHGNAPPPITHPGTSLGPMKFQELSEQVIQELLGNTR